MGQWNGKTVNVPSLELILEILLIKVNLREVEGKQSKWVKK